MTGDAGQQALEIAAYLTAKLNLPITKSTDSPDLVIACALVPFLRQAERSRHNAEKSIQMTAPIIARITELEKTVQAMQDQAPSTTARDRYRRNHETRLAAHRCWDAARQAEAFWQPGGSALTDFPLMNGSTHDDDAS
jgi:hypothetical protein